MAHLGWLLKRGSRRCHNSCLVWEELSFARTRAHVVVVVANGRRRTGHEEMLIFVLGGVTIDCSLVLSNGKMRPSSQIGR